MRIMIRCVSTGSHYTNVYSSWTSFAWRIAPLLSQARVHIYTAVKYIGHLTAKLEVISATITLLVTFLVARPQHNVTVNLHS